MNFFKIGLIEGERKEAHIEEKTNESFVLSLLKETYGDSFLFISDLLNLLFGICWKRHICFE